MEIPPLRVTNDIFYKALYDTYLPFAKSEAWYAGRFLRFAFGMTWPFIKMVYNMTLRFLKNTAVFLRDSDRREESH